MESITFLFYHLIGGERLWVPRLLSSVFWLIGAAFLYTITKRLLSADAALISVAYYLFLPYGVVASQNFQPDPLMVMLLLISLQFVVAYHSRPSIRALLIAAGATSIAVLVKPVCVFVIVGAFASLSVWRLGVRKSILSLHSAVFIGVILLPVIGYYVYGIATGGFLKGQAGNSFRPELLLQRQFWTRWLHQVDIVFGYTAVVGSLIGALLVPRGLPRSLIVGLWVGYLLFGMVFTYHISSHDYYQLQFVPIVALSLSALGALMFAALGRVGGHRCRAVGTTATIILAVALGIAQAPGGLAKSDRIARLRMFEEIGRLVDHSTETIIFGGAYGQPLRYHAQLAGAHWPYGRRLRGSILSPRKCFAKVSQRLRRPAEYFIITSRKGFNKDRKLKWFLSSRYPVFARAKHYLIFDLREQAISADGEEEGHPTNAP